MKVLIVGSRGQVSSAVNEVLTKSDKHEIFALSRKELNIADRNGVFNAVTQLQPDVVVNGAALTNVDLCESEVDNAFGINAFGVRNIAQACEFIDSHLIHISTDFVFDGKTSRPYSEYDICNPLSVYAKSKYGGDVEALRYSKSTVLRVAWVFGNPNGDFFSWVLQGLKDETLDSLIDDQFSTPTYSFDVAKVIEKVIASKVYGLINVANKGETSRLEMGQELVKKLGISKSLSGIPADSLNRPAPRPNYSALSTSLLENIFDIELGSWQSALDEHIKRIGAK